MDALAFVMFLAWIFATAVWLLTFVRPFRTAFARGFLAPRKLPLRSARWRLGVAAISAFTLFMVIVVNEPQPQRPSLPLRQSKKVSRPRRLGHHRAFYLRGLSRLRLRSRKAANAARL
jgi:hypothetical protein